MKKEIITIVAASSLFTFGFSEQDAPDTPASEAYPESQQIEQPVDAAPAGGPEYVEYTGILDSSHLISESVYNMQDEEIGTLDRLMFDSETGEIGFAVVSVGGFLGIGEHLVAVPWSEFTAKKEKKSEAQRDQSKLEMQEENQKVAEASEEQAEVNAEQQEDADHNAEQQKEMAEAEKEQAEDPAGTSEEQQVAEASDSGKAEKEVKELVVRLYLDADREHLEKAPEFDPTLPAMTETKEGSDSVSEFWNKDWENAKENRDKNETASL